MFCRAYKATELYTYILPLVKSLTHPDALRANLTNGLTACRISELAQDLNETEIAATARSIVLADLWLDQLELPVLVHSWQWLPPSTNSQSSSVHATAQDPYNALMYGERMEDKEVIGAAYYQLMLASLSPGVYDERLTAHQRHCLQRGTLACAVKWQELFDLWGDTLTSELEDHHGYEIERWLHGAWRALALRKLANYDVLGKAVEVIRCALRTGIPEETIAQMKQSVDDIKSNLHTLFICDVATTSTSTPSSPEAPVHSPAITLVQDDTLRLPSGSLVFSVEGVQFRVCIFSSACSSYLCLIDERVPLCRSPKLYYRCTARGLQI